MPSRDGIKRLRDMEIWKFDIGVGHSSLNEIPKGAEIIHIDEQRGSVCIWAICDPKAEKEKREFKVFGTGHTINNETLEKLVYVGSCQTKNQVFVFHVFEQKIF
jgi:hypothetical protein